MEKVIKITNTDALTELEALQNEVNARQSLIAFFLSNNLTSSVNYKVYCDEYTKIFADYTRAKNKFAAEFPEYATSNNWVISFENKTITFYD